MPECHSGGPRSRVDRMDTIVEGYVSDFVVVVGCVDAGARWDWSGGVVDRLGNRTMAVYWGGKLVRYASSDHQPNFSSILRGMSLVLTLPPAALIASSHGGVHQVNHKPTHRYPTTLHITPGTRTRRTRFDRRTHRAARIAISSIRMPAGCKRKNWKVGPLFSKLRWIA